MRCFICASSPSPPGADIFWRGNAATKGEGQCAISAIFAPAGRRIRGGGVASPGDHLEARRPRGAWPSDARRDTASRGPSRRATKRTETTGRRPKKNGRSHFPSEQPGGRRVQQAAQAGSGSRMRNVVPTPFLDSKVISPPWASTIPFAIASPSPVPPGLPWLVNGWNRLFQMTLESPARCRARLSSHRSRTRRAVRTMVAAELPASASIALERRFCRTRIMRS